MDDKVYNHIFNDILERVLQLSEDPSQFAEYLTQQIRELIGVRTIIIAIRNESDSAQIFGVYPKRRSEWAHQNAIQELAEKSFGFDTIQFIDKNSADPSIISIFNLLDIEKAITIPLIAANRMVGTLLLLDMMDLFGIDSVIKLLTRLSGVFALIIRNALMYQNLENLVNQRTQELQKISETAIAAEEKYKELSDLFRKMVDIIPDMLWAKDLDHNYIFVNQSLCDHLLIAKDTQEPIGKSDLYFALRQRELHPENPLWHTFGEISQDSDKQVIESGTTQQIDEFGYVKGQYVYLDVIKTPLRNAKGEIQGVVGTGRDVTDRKKAEMELIAAKEHAVESDRLKSAFLANMSHEIRTPMNGILGFAELLKEPNLTGEEQQQYIEIIQKSGDRMLNIINEIIDISRIESGLMKIDVCECNVNIQLNELCIFFLPEAKAKGLELQIQCALPNELAMIHTDRDKLNAILTNLIKNALKFTQSGTILIGYELHSKNSATGHQEFVFYVKDTGMGIPKERQDAIFERFIHADIENKKAMQGAGLGLAISKSFVEMLGGKIWVESMVDEGSTFYFALPNIGQPIHLEPTPKSEDSDKSNEMDKKMNILIVDDDETSSLFLSVVLAKHAHCILKAYDGAQAVELSRKHSEIDMILMDMQMPILGGLEATRQIRQFNKDVLIIAQTAFGLAGDREKAIEAGCNDYVSKPINSALLIDIIHKHLN
ncbi:MAG TPA: histidine kinase dimerization/phospho-acceptor domain-containing protein [Bacteroidales bacterium]|nr:histidine kinase dimerization/phospho-acceptor domain-containing protein [Bacteroidales bacterium]